MKKSYLFICIAMLMACLVSCKDDDVDDTPNNAYTVSESKEIVNSALEELNASVSVTDFFSIATVYQSFKTASAYSKDASIASWIL